MSLIEEPNNPGDLTNTDPEGKVPQPGDGSGNDTIVFEGDSGGGGVPSPTPTPTPTEATVDAGDKNVIIGFFTNILGAEVLQDNQSLGVSFTPVEVKYTTKELLTPKFFSVRKENSESTDIFKIYTVKKRTDFKKNFDLNTTVFFYFDIIVEKFIEGSFKQVRVISPYRDGELINENRDEYLRLDFKLTQAPPPPQKTVNINFITNFPTSNFPLSYRLPDGTTGKVSSKTIKYTFRDVDFGEGLLQPQIEIYPTDILTNYEFPLYRLEFSNGFTLNFPGPSALSTLTPELDITFRIEAKQIPPAPKKINIVFQNDLFDDEQLTYKLSTDGIRQLPNGSSTVTYTLKDKDNFITFGSLDGPGTLPNDVAVRYEIQEANGNIKEFSTPYFSYNFGDTDIRVKTLFTKNPPPPPIPTKLPPLPKICNDINASNYGQEGDCVYPPPPKKIKIIFENDLAIDDLLYFKLSDSVRTPLINGRTELEYTLKSTDNNIVFSTKTGGSLPELTSVNYQIESYYDNVTETRPDFRLDLNDSDVIVRTVLVKKDPPPPPPTPTKVVTSVLINVDSSLNQPLEISFSNGQTNVLSNGQNNFDYILKDGGPNYFSISNIKDLSGYNYTLQITNGNKQKFYENELNILEEIEVSKVFANIEIVKKPETVIVLPTPTPTPTPTPVEEKPIKITITSDVVLDDALAVRLSNGVVENIRNGSKTLLYKPNINGANYLEFFPVSNVNYSEYSISYSIQNGNKLREINTFDFKEEINNSDIGIFIVLNKITQQPRADEPTLSLPDEIITYNLFGSSKLEIPFYSLNAESIRYSIGNIQREISPVSPIVLENSVFNNGVGQYKLTAQPYSRFGGSGKNKSLVINVIQSTFIPGPDIQTINYPSRIQGEDFVGFNVNFDIDYSSINTNYIKIYVSKVDESFLLLGNAKPNGKITFNVGEILSKSRLSYNRGTDQISFDLILVPYNNQADELALGRQEKISIFFDQGLRIRREDLVSDLRDAFQREFNASIIKKDTSKILTHQLHLGDGNNKLIATWAIDRQTLDDDSLVLKLYEPLPNDVETEQQVWISKIQSIPIVDEIRLVDREVSKCTPLQPNFNVDVSDPIGYEIIDSLVSSGSITSVDLIAQYVSSSEFTLEELDLQFITGSGSNIDYYWKDFVKYSSAEERVENFFYKVRLLESYQNDINILSSGSAWTGSVEVVKERQRTEQKIKQLKGGFDSFEKYLYDTTGSLSYPKVGISPVSSSTQDALDWLYVARASAREYDTYNVDLLVNNIPRHIRDDERGEEFILFFNMIGQHFDILWAYSKGIAKSRRLEHKLNVGISNDLIYHMLESLGWDADMGVASQLLWEYALGKNTDGTSASSLPGKQRQYEIWRRLLNNLPYLLKHKGTRRAMYAAMACYGIPTSMLSIMEFGGPNEPTRGSTTKVTFDDRTAAINIDNNSSIIIPWKEYVSGSYSDYPNSVEARILTTQRQTQTIFENEGNWSLKITSDTGSLARLQFEITSSGVHRILSSSTFPFYNDEYTQIVLNRNITGSSEEFQVWAKEGFQGRIRNEESASFSWPTGSTSWESGSQIIVGSDFTGSIDEFRLWRVDLLETSIENHALIPDAIDGNSYSSSTEDLLFRLDFEYPRNLAVSSSSGIPSGSIKNVSINQGYGESYATASNFPSASSYPFNYTPYDRTVVANVPSIGLTFGEKFRFEEQEKITDLSHKARATKKSFDQAPIDTDRLGLFFSPVQEINMDILKSLGNFNIDDYIGNPADLYEDKYSDLEQLREYYFQRYNLNFNEYIQLVRYIDKTIYTTLESLAPARAKVSKGLLIEPHFLERSKTKWERPTGLVEGEETNLPIVVPVTSSYINNEVTLNLENEVSINGENFVYDSNPIDTINENLASENISFESDLDATQITNLSSDNITYESDLDINDDIVIEATKDNFISLIELNENILLETSKIDYQTNLNLKEDFPIDSEILVNSGSDMGGISISVNAQIVGTIQGEYESDVFKEIGLDKNSPFVAGFGLYAEDGNSIRSYYDDYGNLKQERVKVFKIKESYTVKTPENINTSDSSLGSEKISRTYFRNKISILPFTGSNGLEINDPQVSGNITEVSPLNGYLPSHYRYVGDLTSGLINSYHKGAKQTSLTTLDGSSPVQIFTTNPNTLRVTDTGRGSGEPILEVE
jgi:hypothetical protein